MAELYFEVVSKLGKRIRTTQDYWHRIVGAKHPSMRGREDEVKAALKEPDEVRVSQRDATVHLYYRKLGSIYICVVVKHENSAGFIITTYPTENIKMGRRIWEK